MLSPYSYLCNQSACRPSQSCDVLYPFITATTVIAPRCRVSNAFNKSETDCPPHPFHGMFFWNPRLYYYPKKHKIDWAGFLNTCYCCSSKKETFCPLHNPLLSILIKEKIRQSYVFLNVRFHCSKGIDTKNPKILI